MGAHAICYVVHVNNNMLINVYIMCEYVHTDAHQQKLCTYTHTQVCTPALRQSRGRAPAVWKGGRELTRRVCKSLLPGAPHVQSPGLGEPEARREGRRRRRRRAKGKAQAEIIHSTLYGDCVD